MMKINIDHDKTNLNIMFIELLTEFISLITEKNQIKSKLLYSIQNTYDLSETKTQLFYECCEKSKFNYIRIEKSTNTIVIV